MSEPLSREELKIRQRLKDDFPHYAEKCLKIRTKGSGIKPFIMNDSQWFVHHRLENQLREQGRVRALILKGRQWGCSTLVKPQRFCRTRCRRSFHSAARIWAEREIKEGRLTVEKLRVVL